MSVQSESMRADPLDKADELSLALLKDATTEIAYSANALKLSIK